MFWLRVYELYEMEYGHPSASYFLEADTGPGFLNAVNRYYGRRVWR